MWLFVYTYPVLSGILQKCPYTEHTSFSCPPQLSFRSWSDNVQPSVYLTTAQHMDVDDESAYEFELCVCEQSIFENLSNASIEGYPPESQTGICLFFYDI